MISPVSPDIPLDVIYEICKYSLEVYRVAIYDRRFHSYMRAGGRLLELRKTHTKGEYISGNIYYTLCRQLHRDDGPASISHESETWYQYGVVHREGGPACTNLSGTQQWYHWGQLHRVDGPAILYPDGSQSWYRYGQRHRIGGPAIIWPTAREWWVDGVKCDIQCDAATPDDALDCDGIYDLISRQRI